MRRSPIAAVGRWSSIHPWRAIALWMVFVVSSVAVLQLTGSKTLNGGAIGESKRGYAMLDQHNDWPNQVVHGYLHSDSLTANAPAFRSAITDVKLQVQSALGAAVTTRSSGDGHSALLTAPVTQGSDSIPPALGAAA